MRFEISLLAAALLTASPCASGPLTVSPTCVLLKDGAPFRGVGVNYYDSFLRTLDNPADRSYEPQFKRLAQAGFPFLRFAVLPYWAKDARPFVEDPDQLFERLDRFVADATANNLGLIPSVFFNFATIPDVMGEPVGAWFDENSHTAAFARDFAQRLARRYAGSRTVWIWEFSNETNNWSDFSDAYRYLPVDPTQSRRSLRDNYTSQQMRTALSAFRAAIHEGDPAAMVTSGYGLPRHNAWNLAHGQTTVDRRADFERAFADESAPSDFASLHLYSSALQGDYTARFADDPVNVEQFLDVAARAAQAACRPLFLGELGVADTDASGDERAALAAFRRLGDAFAQSPAPLAAAWVFDFAYQDTHDGAMNMTFANRRKDWLVYLEQLNHRLAGSGEEN